MVVWWLLVSLIGIPGVEMTGLYLCLLRPLGPPAGQTRPSQTQLDSNIFQSSLGQREAEPGPG